MDDYPELERLPLVPGSRWWDCSYELDGVRYGISIPAPTAADAARALHDAFGNGSVDGDLAGVVRLSEAEGRAIARNLGLPPAPEQE